MSRRFSGNADHGRTEWRILISPYCANGVRGVEVTDQGSTERRYWKDDVVEMLATCNRYKRDIRAGRRRVKNYEEFKAGRILYVRARTQHAQEARDWFDARRKAAKELEALYNRRYKQVLQRCEDLGYWFVRDIEDLNRSLDDGIFQYLSEFYKHDITDYAWERMKPALEPCLLDWRCSWPVDQHVISQRMLLIKDTYDDYKRTLHPIEWLRLPPLKMISMMPAFRSLIYDKPDIPLDRLRCDEAARDLPQFISTYYANVKDVLLRTMGEAINLTRGTANQMVVTDDHLALASSAFYMRRDDLFCSLTDVLGQLSYSEAEDRRGYGGRFWLQLQDPEQFHYGLRLFKWDRIGHAICQNLAIALGLDPQATRPEDLDALDRYFFCRSEHCMAECIAMPWRRVVSINVIVGSFK
ncbi:hypothetical protein EVJ58_g3781 [Rhodofomes roseus]|uniref:Uncharacterized protein n=1 Tax=Rhodofomes roseus TaxID=34475 RepID=A0A4Y9YLT5_9APHY|nr:hypothetical protein EVJ58_g3781 [Rhodofomes roseus]